MSIILIGFELANEETIFCLTCTLKHRSRSIPQKTHQSSEPIWHAFTQFVKETSECAKRPGAKGAKRPGTMGAWLWLGFATGCNTTRKTTCVAKAVTEKNSSHLTFRLSACHL